VKTSRSHFIRATAAFGAGLSLALRLPAGAQSGIFAPNAWVRVAPDETVTIFLSKSEMGQGVIHGLPTVLADELDVDPQRIRTEVAPPNAAYVDPELGEQATGGSTSIQSTWLPLRRAGATARAMLVAAAAKQWDVDPVTCTTRAGVVYHAASARSATYGSVALAASALPAPADVPLKPANRFALIGRDRARPDIPSKVNGSVQYGIDVRLPGMVFAAIARSPVFGGRVKNVDARKARAVAGVIDVVRISNGVAVVAKNTWSAFQGRNALTIAWDEGTNSAVDSEQLFAEAARLAHTRAGEHVAITRGNPATARGTILEATYRGPFLAHAAMEPMNTTAFVHDGMCEVWTPTQVQQRAQVAASKGSGLPLERCTIHTTFLGGGFGRRLEADYVQEAAEVARAVDVPVKVTWSREDDIQHDYYRPMSLDVVRGVVANRELVAFSHLVVQPSWLQRWKPAWIKGGVDPLALEGVIDAPYAIPNFRASYIDHQHGIPIGSWRAPQANWNTFVTECFIDELAHAAHEDPVVFRLGLLRKNARAAGVLRMATERAGWGHRRAGVGQGVAMIFWAGSFAAMVAEVSLQEKVPKVHRVVVAVDCGTAVNPDIVVQQAQGATNFGLSAALTGKITIAKGRVEQNNFYDYTVLRIADAPAIEVHIVPSDAAPSGIGELCTPPIAPAVGNALFNLTGKRIRTLPFSGALV
jgi:isoquinoline 1-oxidoreductase beta subunit